MPGTNIGWDETDPANSKNAGLGAQVNRVGDRRGMHGNQPKGARHHGWVGGVVYDSYGYRLFRQPDHPRANSRGYVKEHLLIADAALGKRLPPRAVVHHVNGLTADNRPENLVVCEDSKYHQLLHRRTDALRECGHAHWLRCALCSKLDDPNNLHVGPGEKHNYHPECQRVARRKRRERGNARI